MALIDRLNEIGDAIREQNGTTEKIPLVDMPQAILDIVSGGGVTYTNIVYNEDNTIALTDKDGVVHTMECEYVDGKLVGVTYDGKAVELTYDGDVLVKVGKTDIDVSNAPVNSATLDHTVTFMVDGEPYEVVSVKDGTSINAPVNPNKEGHKFFCWENAEGVMITFPHTPTGTYNLLAEFIQSYAEKLCSYYGVDKTTNPYILLTIDGVNVDLFFGYNIAEDNSKFYYRYKADGLLLTEITDLTDYDTIFKVVMNRIQPSSLEARTSYYSVRNTHDYLTNVDGWTPSAYKSIHYFD